MSRNNYKVPLESTGERIDKWLIAQCGELTRSALQRLVEDGFVEVNGLTVSKNYKLKNGDEVSVEIPEPVELNVLPQNLPIEIVYEDDELLVVNKPKGMVVHPASGNYEGTLVNALLYHCNGRLSSINGVIRPGIVHRIDKNTSGLLIVAKTDFSHQKLAEQIKAHSFTREYCAVVCGRFKEQNGTINAPIGRDKFDRKKMCVTTQNSKEAITHYEVLSELDSFSLVKFTLETGRTHQIRVHCSYVGKPIYGDDVYGKAVKGVNGQCLHAKKIGFVHPKTNEYLEFDSELPNEFKEILRKLKLV